MLATLIEPTLARIGPELAVTARVNEIAWAGSGIPGSGWTRDADACGEAPERTELDPDVR